MKKTDFKGKFLTACAALFTVGAAVIRCIQLFYYTDLSTGYVVSGGKNLISELYLIIAVAVLLFAGVSFIFFNKKTSEFDFTPGKGMFLLSLLCAAGMFYDFIYQCVSCYDYISKTSYIAVNRVIPMVLCIISALICCAYFAILSQCSRSSRFEFGRLKILCFAPFLWVFCNVLVGLTAYGDALYDVDSALKNFCLVFGLLFFFFYAAQREKSFSRMGALAFFGYTYGALCFVLVFPRIVSLIAGVSLTAPEYSSPAFLFTGAFAFVAAINISFKKKV